ncbi:MACPF domain-containing protein At4g24290-like isoform X2 [Diospyros lotus]|uniref:MACPF domain-containing protein At4g24290-like isoform X2 n=1 Tax=Diospyros lotus TaxID=55363 RepID=UPI002257302D|nr:MACPF domain-containing protein At4g24290-like isoform X2 [Diospyros lotus]
MAEAGIRVAKERGLQLRAAAEAAIESIGLGYDLTVDLRLKYCKNNHSCDADPRLITIDIDDKVRDIAIPGGILVQNVSKSIKCDKGERLRFSSDVLSFQQMSEQFNQDLSLSGKIPTGHFNAAFEFSGCWQKDAANTKALAFDGVFITLYSIVLEKSQVALRDYVKQAVPSSWDPAALARFIERFGTHVVVGVKMGGKDIVYVKQQHSSPLQPADVLKRLKEVADKRFGDGTGQYDPRKDIAFLWKRRGGNNNKNIPHDKWCQTVQLEPDVISLSLIPISSLLSGIDGSGFLSHAINLYLRYKPPIEELYQFLEFQLPKQWAPVFGELAVGPEKKQSGASLQFSLMGPKLYVNTDLVDVGKRPVTGMRLYLEGKRNNCLAIHLQHLSSLPKSFQLQDEANGNSRHSYDRRYYEKVQWKSFSHVCTAPVESDELSVVTGAWFEVRDSGLKKVLFLGLQFSRVVGGIMVKKPEWDGSPAASQKSGVISTLISTRFSSAEKQPQPAPRPSDINVNSALYPGGPPVPAHSSKLLRFIDTTEMTRGPQDPPGYWAVSGAKLSVDKGKISLRVKYSLLTVAFPDEEVQLR